jgi:hypothetical protein
MPIPRIFFTYWEGDQLSQLHSYTITSILKQNPNIQVIIYTSTIDSNKFVDWTTCEHSIKIDNTISLDELVKIDPTRIMLRPIDFQNDYKIKNDISCIFKADFIRIAKLYEHGGLWFDMDIFFIKPFPDYLFNTDIELYFHNTFSDQMSNIVILFMTKQGVIPTGLILSTPKNDFISMLYYIALDKISNPSDLTNSYQVLGPNLWTSLLQRHFNRINGYKCLSKSTVYPYEADYIHMLYELNDKDTSLLQEDSFAIHWYNGAYHTKNFINRFDKNNIDPNRCFMEKMLIEYG